MKPFPTTLLAAVLVSAFAAHGSGAMPEEPIFFGDRVDVELVVVDTFVEARDGSPVTDLALSDFRVFEDGREVELLHVTRPPGGSSSGAAVDSRSPRRLRAAAGRYIIFVDHLHLSARSRFRVVKQLLDELEAHLLPADEVMVVSYAGQAEVVLPLTNDRKALRRALREQAELSALNVTGAYEEERVLQTLESYHNYSDRTCFDSAQFTREYAQRVDQRVRRTIDELQHFVDSLSGFSGTKALLHVSDGIPLIAGLPVHRFVFDLCSGAGAAQGMNGAVDASFFGESRWSRFDPTKFWADLQEFNTADEWARLGGHANTYQVSFYTYQASGPPALRSGGVDSVRLSPTNESEMGSNKQDALAMLADETGGVALLDAGDIGRAIDRMTTDARFGYELAYAPLMPADGRQHSIRVEVDRPGLTVRHRKSYRSKRADERVADRVFASLLFGLEDNPLGVRLETAEGAGGRPPTAHVSVHVPLDRLVLLPAADGPRGAFSVFVATRGDRGQVTGVGQRTIPLRLPAVGTEREYLYVVEVPLFNGLNEVAVAVQDTIGGGVSYLRRQLSAGSGR